MYKLCIFAGTLDGRRLIESLAGEDVCIRACVATEYGETLLKPGENLRISAGRMDREEMAELMNKERFDLVIDATHPYALNVTECIAGACAESGTEYLRLLRENSSLPGSAYFAENIQQAVDYLNTAEGRILLACGSRDIEKYKGIKDFENRVYARVLPMQQSLELCAAAGMKPSHIIAMQGPFSKEMNTATLKAVGASYLVTKDGGDAGGFNEKAEAALAASAGLVVIGRPPERAGLTFGEMEAELSKRFGFKLRPEVKICGIGPGSREAMTGEVKAAIENADCLIGAQRMLEHNPGEKPCFGATAPGKIADFILEHREFNSFCVLMSGDSGFYSGCKKLLPLLGSCSTEVLPGISSLSCLCARLKCSYENVKCISLHGREENLIKAVRENEKVFSLMGGDDGVNKLCDKLISAGLGDVRLSIGERLSYPDEKLSGGTAYELKDGKFSGLAAVLIENKNYSGSFTPGLPDESFIRSLPGERTVPMTKSEVRALCISKLRLEAGSLCWDVGAGTGSVSVEMALAADSGKVYAIEKNPAALELTEKNRDKFFLKNIELIPGEAPAACRELPAPDRAFIGGSSGNMREIISLILRKNPACRIVASALSLESIGELSACLKEFKFRHSEVIAVSIARAREAGNYRLMEAQNPVYIFSMEGGEP